MLRVSSHMPYCLYSKGLGNFIPYLCSHSISQTLPKPIIYSFTAILFEQFVAYCFHLYTPVCCERSYCFSMSIPVVWSWPPRWAAWSNSSCLIKFSYWQDFSGKCVHWRLLQLSWHSTQKWMARTKMLMTCWSAEKSNFVMKLQ